MENKQSSVVQNAVSESCVIREEEIDVSGKEREILKMFIESYETMPELWDPRRADYKNSTKREHSLRSLLEIFKHIKPDAKINDVKKKINSLRTNYRKEIKKIIASKRSGAGTENVYVPTCWTFYALNFLGECESPVHMNAASSSKHEVSNVINFFLTYVNLNLCHFIVTGRNTYAPYYSLLYFECL